MARQNPCLNGAARATFEMQTGRVRRVQYRPIVSGLEKWIITSAVPIHLLPATTPGVVGYPDSNAKLREVD